MNRTDIYPSGTPAENAYTYFAFISYKSADEKWARWLKRNLQRYRLPVGTQRKHPHVQKRCSPVFLDKTNLTPGLLDSGLAEEVQAARYLIVICSRKAAENSRYLDDELRYFLEGSGDLSRVIPFIVDESRNPAEECFPAYLAELSRKKNIAGVSIYDDGPRSALLRVISAMLGIKREELESDDRRRRRRHRLIAAGLALILLAGSGVCWDYFRVKTAYYTDYTEVYGTPKGLGELKKADLKGMNAHVALVSSRGKVRELRIENSAGRLVPRENTGSPGPFSKAEYEYAGEKLASVSQYSENGHLTCELHYISPNTIDLVRNPEAEEGNVFSAAAPLPSHSTGAIPGDGKGENYKSKVIRYLVIYDASGFTEEIRYCADRLKAHEGSENPGALALVDVMVVLEDVNLLHRGGEDGLRFARENALRIAMLPEDERIDALRALDREMIGRNLSPGGAADMLALGYLLDAWRTLSKDLREVSA